MLYYARALGADIGSGVDLHTLPPITGMLELGDGCSVEPEVDLSGHWIDGDVIHIGEIKIGDGASVGSRSTLLPGARIGRDAVVEPGSAVFGRVKANQQWAGSPATKVGKRIILGLPNIRSARPAGCRYTASPRSSWPVCRSSR